MSPDRAINRTVLDGNNAPYQEKTGDAVYTELGKWIREDTRRSAGARDGRTPRARDLPVHWHPNHKMTRSQPRASGGTSHQKVQYRGHGMGYRLV